MQIANFNNNRVKQPTAVDFQRSGGQQLLWSKQRGTRLTSKLSTQAVNKQAKLTHCDSVKVRKYLPPNSQEAKKPHAIQKRIFGFERIDERNSSLHQHKSTIVSNFCYSWIKPPLPFYKCWAKPCISPFFV